MSEPLDEFGLIRRYFVGLTTSVDGVVLGIGDDAALLQVPAGQELLVTTDTLVAGRHFPMETPAFDIGWKSLAVNLSDLAAMGATPRWFTLALTLPELHPNWLADFSAGLKSLADAHHIALVGGDTTRGPLSISITAMGLVPQGGALRRSGAKAGDVIAVTGTLGDAALALRHLQGGGVVNQQLLQRLYRPEPRVTAGIELRDLARAALDLSDGLAGDLRHILDASDVGAEIHLHQLPQSSAFTLAHPEDAHALQTQGGDDYELLVCLPPEKLAQARQQLDVPLTAIGRVTTQAGLRFLDASGQAVALAARGYQHF